tara:strand:+ start:3501 stop:4082 length:582 start_codon:yes stop_codon:yes gene_type:complete
MVAALYVQEDGCYSNLDGVDVWGVSRDARLYAGPHPVVAHPPCARWCMLASLNEHRYGHKVGDDGGCFEAALAAVRTYGGVLEHPAFSKAWGRFGLPIPTEGHWTRGLFDKGWAASVYQRNYGHPARKRTWLYYVGDILPPPLDWSAPEEPTAWVASDRPRAIAPKAQLTKKQAKATPEAFRAVLLDIARGAR